MKNILFVIFCFWIALGIAQNPNDVLFTVEGQEVTVSEFDYIYNKNNKEANYTKPSIDEYLNLYIKFKLKVQRARDMKLDTIKQLNDELAGYRKQLANTYLNDREVKDRLVKEAYERMKEDVRFAHILVILDQRASPEDTAKAFQIIKGAYDRIRGGESFEAVAQDVSQDDNTKNRGGDVGYIAAMMPSGFYAVETAAYETEVGQVSGIVRSSAGYHLIKPLDKRPARGRMDASHILLRFNKDKSNEEIIKSKINQFYNRIQSGVTFEEMARKYSEDGETSRKGGFIGTFGINMYEQEFEDVAFALENDGDISKPVKTRLGYHIIKRMRKPEPESFEKAKRRLEGQVNKNERIEYAKATLISRIKDEGGFKMNEENYKAYAAQVSDDLQNYRWQAPMVKATELFSFGDEMSVSTVDFGKFMRSNARTRMRMPKTTSKEEITQTLLEEFINAKALEYEERKLADKYPDFKALMREYEEGILLFEATKINVWDRASEDTTGLKAFHEKNKMKYMWDERARLVTFSLPAGNDKLLGKIKKFLAKMPADQAVAKVNKKAQLVEFSAETVEQSNIAIERLDWKEKSMSEITLDEETGRTTFTMIDKIIPSHPKSLSEARGYIIADYQDQLEKEWVAKLRSEYDVKVNQDVLNSLIK